MGIVTRICERKRHAWIGIGVCTAASMALGVLAVEPGTKRAPVETGSEAGMSRTVTLISGDRVTVSGVDANSLSINPGPGRAHVHFTSDQRLVTRGEPKHLYVIPSDAEPLIAAGRLDRQLFDVTALLESHYDDGERDDLPLILSYEQGTPLRNAASSLTVSGATIGAQLSTANAVAVSASKSQIGALWNALTNIPADSVATLNGSVKKIWLDALLKPALDRSVPQVGAPTAWESGYTGRGVVVAVLDTGIDDSHPDLAGKVIEARNFTDEVDDDIDGHGTHVASTIASSGGAANGMYRGVAPDALLLEGKVCRINGCPLSAIVAGMEWAVIDKQAAIVNMSLGGTDTADIDPMEETLNRLSAQYGTLFVVAAGNSGGQQTIGSPASQDAALAVGAIDREERTASFSSRGPRIGDKGVKPDIAAPGVRIVAARASNTEAGTPVGSFHVELSGTSMATPHVAGAAAIIKQRYPNWTGAQVKALLMGSARINPVPVFEQGAGRLNVATAMTARAIALPSSLSLGVAQFPHEDDEPIRRTVTYRNISSAAIRLELQLDVRGPDGAASPAGMFAVSPTVLSIPAGGSATATVTADTRVAASNGLYTGRLLASGAEGISHNVPLSIEREREVYDVAVSHTDLNGGSSVSYTTNFYSLDRINDDFAVRGSGSQEQRVRLPPGRYLVRSSMRFAEGQGTLFKPTHLVSGPGSSLVMDGSLAKRVQFDAPKGAVHIVIDVGWWRTATWGRLRSSTSYLNPPATILYTGHIGPSEEGFSSYVLGQWQATTTDSGGTPHIEHFAGAWPFRGRFPTGLSGIVRREDMAAVNATYLASPPTLESADLITFTYIPELSLGVGLGETVTLPYQRTEYFAVREEIGWYNRLIMDTLPVNPRAEFVGAPLTYRAPVRYASRWNEPVYGPHNDPGRRTVARYANEMRVDVPLFGDRAGHAGRFRGTSRTVLSRNGQQLGAINSTNGLFTNLPPELGRFRLDLSATQQIVAFSTQVKASWSFDSARVDGSVPVTLPILTAQPKPPLNSQHQADGGTVMRMPITVRRDGQPGPVEVKELSCEVSFDDGATWNKVPVERSGDDWIAVFLQPARGNFVSLRMMVSDFSGNSLEEELIRAYGLSPAAGTKR